MVNEKFKNFLLTNIVAQEIGEERHGGRKMICRCADPRCS